MPKKIIVLLIGGRLTPNLLGVLALRPNAVEFVVSTDTPEQYAKACQVLGTIDGLTVSDKPEYVSAYDMASGENACRVVADRHPDAEIFFDTSSAPKIMSFAGYEVARQRRQHAIVVDTAHQQVIDVTQRGAVAATLPLNLQQYLACYGRSPSPKFDFMRLSSGREQAVEAATYLANVGSPLQRLLPRFRNWSQGKDQRRIEANRTQPLDKDQRQILWRLAELRLLSDLSELPDGRVAYTVDSDEDFNFINGTWLEVFAWDQAQRQHDPQGQPIFNQCAFSLEIPSDNACKEIDVACLYQGQIIIAYCKTEVKPFNTDYLDELYAVSNLIGGEFASRVFITNILPPPESDLPARQEYQRFMAQAKDRKIVVVTGERLAKVGPILARQAIEPEFRRI